MAQDAMRKSIRVVAEGVEGSAMARPKPPFPNGANGFLLIVCRRNDQLALDRSISIHLGNSPTICTDSQSVLEGNLRIALKHTRSRGKRQSQLQQPTVLLRIDRVPPTQTALGRYFDRQCTDSGGVRRSIAERPTFHVCL